MALYSVDVTTARLIEQGYSHEGMHPTQTPELKDEPEWMSDLADASIAESELSDAVRQLDVASGVVTTVGTNNQADFLGVAVDPLDQFDLVDVSEPLSGGELLG